MTDNPPTTVLKFFQSNTAVCHGGDTSIVENILFSNLNPSHGLAKNDLDQLEKQLGQNLDDLTHDQRFVLTWFDRPPARVIFLTPENTADEILGFLTDLDQHHSQGLIRTFIGDQPRRTLGVIYQRIKGGQSDARDKLVIKIIKIDDPSNWFISLFVPHQKYQITSYHFDIVR